MFGKNQFLYLFCIYMGELTEKNAENASIQNSSDSVIKEVTTPLWDSIAEYKLNSINE